MNLPVSVIAVSDYEAGKKTWADERAAVTALLSDPAGAPSEIIVVESADCGPAPSDLVALAPHVKIQFEPLASSSALKDAGLKYCTHDLVAVVEADCVPEIGWLKYLADAIQADNSLHAVSGLTHYGAGSSMLRVMSLLDRGYIEQKNRREQYVHISNNGAIYRRDVLERFPYPDERNPFVAAERRQLKMRDAGLVFGVEPRARMLHAYGGPEFVADVRRSLGFSAARMIAGSHRPAPGLLLVLRVLNRRIRGDLKTIRKSSRRLLKWWDWPLLTAMMIVVRVPEAIGALEASRSGALHNTAYR